jgi:carbon-monoxide dehydrogenase small subunit
MALHNITLTVNDAAETVEVASNTTLLTVLRERIGLTGSKNGCSAGECGACTVLVNDEPINACLILAIEVDGAEIVTAEGVAQNGQLDPLQEALIERGAIQCGFCTPGMLITARALLNRNPRPEENEIKDALRGNLCRCTGYVRIIDAIMAASKAGG